ncbi:MAG: Trk system potassium transporter TrkA [Xanthomonadales bacterium]|nr:Trk system potassium transporter TrkA [Xanthomonadales bacterium]
MAKNIIVCGAGQVGTTIARQLAGEGINITVIDTNPELVRRIDESHDIRGIVGHASHPETLREADARDADMLIAVTRSDEVNMVACQVAWSLFGVKRRLARLRHGGYTAREAAGLFGPDHLPIDVVISPEAEIADSIARQLRTPGTFDVLPLATGRLELLGTHIEDPECRVVGERIGDLAAQGDFEGLSVMTVVRHGRAFIPDAGTRLEAGDDVHLLVRSERRQALMALFGHRERITRDLVIAGGGNIGLHLARKVTTALASVRLHLIEHDRGRAQHIAGLLGDRVTVLNGDALDRSLLEEAQVGRMETLVAVTNDDETNIFCSFQARQLGCRRAITLVNKRSYESLLPQLGITTVVSPSAITVSTVLRHVRRGRILALHTLREDFGEVVEAQVDAGSRLLAGPLAGLPLPAGLKIGAVLRDGRVLMGRPNTRIQAGDHIVAVVAYSDLRAAESWLGSRHRATT